MDTCTIDRSKIDNKTVILVDDIYTKSILKKIIPAENIKLAKDIIKQGGILLTEYFKEPSSKFDAIKRFVGRDNLQAMFSKAVILTASYRQGEGDSGSRHAMDAGYRYKFPCYAMFNEQLDKNSQEFALNRDLLEKNEAKLLTASSIDEIDELDLNKSSINSNLELFSK